MLATTRQNFTELKSLTIGEGLGVTPSKNLRDSLCTISDVLDDKDNRVFLKNIIPSKRQYSKFDYKFN